MLQVTCFIFAKYEKIIHIDHQKIINTIVKELVHHSLKSGGSITKPHRHNKILKLAIICVERSRLDIFWLHPYLMESRLKIQLGKHFSSSKFIEYLIGSRDRSDTLLR